MTEEGDLEKSYVVVTNIKMYAGVLPPLCRLWVSGKGAGKHANFIILFREYPNGIKSCRRIKLPQGVVACPAVQVEIFLRAVRQMTGKMDQRSADPHALVGRVQGYPVQIPPSVRRCLIGRVQSLLQRPK